MINFLVFSRNRPMQLHALLSSFVEYVSGNYTLTVLHRYDEKYKSSLEEVKKEFKSINFVEENNFEKQTKDLLKGELFSFLVDDIIFKDKLDLNFISHVMSGNQQILCFSLRMGLHLKYCYMLNKKQIIPHGMTQGELFVWNWRDAELDWGYPLSVDGHIFRTEDVRNWLRHLTFKNPNQLEDSLQSIKFHYKINDNCICFHRSKIVNIPVNRVQDEYKNRNAGHEADDLLTAWNDGLRSSYPEFFDISNDAVHSELELKLRKV